MLQINNTIIAEHIMADKKNIVKKLEEAKQIIDNDMANIKTIHSVEHKYTDLSRNLSHFITFVHIPAYSAPDSGGNRHPAPERSDADLLSIHKVPVK